MDFFYRKSKICEPGIGWGLNEQEAQPIRECRDGIMISKEDFRNSAVEGKFTIEIWTPSKIRGNIYQGTFSISHVVMGEWLKKYGYYGAKSGRQFLVIPTILFTKERTQLGTQMEAQQSNE